MSGGGGMVIRAACLQPFAAGWQQPSGEEVREILRRAGLTGAQAAELLGIASSRQIRRWASDELPIPYAAWAILCDSAGIEKIWCQRAN